MSSDQTNVVDIIGFDTGELILTVTDHLEWTGSDNEQILLLQVLVFISGHKAAEVTGRQDKRPTSVIRFLLYVLCVMVLHRSYHSQCDCVWKG
jgi:hypothetical protein